MLVHCMGQIHQEEWRPQSWDSVFPFCVQRLNQEELFNISQSQSVDASIKYLHVVVLLVKIFAPLKTMIAFQNQSLGGGSMLGDILRQHQGRAKNEKNILFLISGFSKSIFTML